MADTAAPQFRRAVVALSGGRTDRPIVALAAEVARPTHAELIGVHVVEIDWTLPLDADVAGQSEDAQRVLDIAEATAEAGRHKLDTVLLQARDVGAAIVDEATERDADLIICGPPVPAPVRRRLRHRPNDPVHPQERPVRRVGHPRGNARGASMKAVIVGCGRVGAGLADELDRAGWQVLIIDIAAAAFDRLPSSFGGLALRGDGTDEDTLLRAGAQGADLFLALTEGDNRNVMAAQLGIEALGARRCIAKINDPVRAEAYAHLGIASLCRTNLMMRSVLEYMGQAAPARPGIYAPIAQHPHLGDEVPAAGTAVAPGPTAAAAGSPEAKGTVAHDDPARPDGPALDSTATEG